MATKEDLDALVELGKEIPDDKKRDRHLSIVKEIAEKVGASLAIDADEEIQEEGNENQEQERIEEERKRDEDRKRFDEEKRRVEEQKRIEQEKRKIEQDKKKVEEKKIEEEKRANEDRARQQAEQRKKEREEREAREKEAKDKEAREQENRNSFRRSSLRKSLNLGLTGNSLEEVQARIPKPTPRGIDLTDSSLAEVYVKIRDDSDATDWMLFLYDGQSNRVTVKHSGSGGFTELQKHLVEEPLYGYCRHTFGDTQRAKFVFLSYTPETLNGLKKAKVAGHKPDVAAFLKYFHVEINALSRDDITVRNLENKLRSAGGADYGSGRGGGTSGGEQFGQIKANAANFYAKTDKESKVDIVYQKGPLSTTPVDLSGRPTVAVASEARKNTVGVN